MRQIIRQRDIVADAWRYPGEPGEPGDGPRVLSLAEFTSAVAAGTAPATGAAVWLEPADAIESLAPHVARLSLVVVNFPKNGEGRGFTQGRLLRQRYHYVGELRAAGAIKRDLLFFLARCGFDAFDLDPAEDCTAALQAFGTFSVAYQIGSDRGVQARTRPGLNRP